MPQNRDNSLGVDLHLELVGAGRRVGLTSALRDAVRSGRLAPGTRLPASRTLAADLGIARSTVAECYAELVAEGWLVARQGSGTRVAERAHRRPDAAPPTPARHAPLGLLPGAADFAEFPRAAWLSAARRAITRAPHGAFGYGDPLGTPALRTALADYLARVRGVHAPPERIVICSGFHHGLSLLARALHARGVRAVAVEEYGLDLYRNLLVEAGLRIPPLELDEQGARTDQLGETGAGAVLLTPAHQFPTGVVLSPARRAAALDWAQSTGGLILEDDYDGEFRYDRKPVGALQGLDPEHVVYFGTASKSVAPALRLGWMVLPQYLVHDVAAAKGAVELVSVLDQLTFAEFIGSGEFDRHVRSRRQQYRRRRDELVTTLAHTAPDVRVRGIAAGLQAVLELPGGAGQQNDTEQRMRRAAEQNGVAVSAMAEFRHEALGDRPARDALVVNYSALSDSAWQRALEVLGRVLS